MVSKGEVKVVRELWTRPNCSRMKLGSRGVGAEEEKLGVEEKGDSSGKDGWSKLKNDGEKDVGRGGVRVVKKSSVGKKVEDDGTEPEGYEEDRLNGGIG